MKPVIWPATAILAAGIVLAACDSADQPAARTDAASDAANTILPPEPDIVAENTASADAPPPTDAWIGKWVGVEGLALDIERGAEPGKYALTVALLDGTDKYVGAAAGETIGFQRDGKQEVIRKATGDETGLKYLAGKKNCLMIQKAEGFCRD